MKMQQGRPCGRPCHSCSLAAPLSALAREPVEARLLLVAERTVEAVKRRLHDIERLQGGLEPLLHGGDAAGRCQIRIAGAIRLEVYVSTACSLGERLEGVHLCLRRIDRASDAIDWHRRGELGAARL